ncbi:TPA: hypothetical protein NJ344_004635 [Vibrio parahaemolyticus]|uniref:hypothetical protein n=1 Tax=Vibrio parahaemolyticus TaxID=670 RepID=UPI0006A5F94C|nr:hypothetical protein [Vibrio parahaemolyticus]HAS6345980.1 hypothetical protein [Vibrio vulnificus]EHR7861147.1 hypothetical protein [Vibrio parahaemolyticus]EJC6932555.1 hypothetical protein [Vibrio parahaemolyticus]KOE76235.1 hypothetical protein ACS91_27780 [Vibrio parahaemolyticus]MBE4313996.1 hypothetical protein [Vibrio parahaemolyticus]
MTIDVITAKNLYITKSKDILDATEMLSKQSYGFKEVFTNDKLKKAKEKLPEYYNWLRKYDEAYTSLLSMEGALPDLNMRNAKVSIMERARNVYVLSLQGYEKELANIEASTNFKLSTGIALIAVLVSLVGVAVA